MNTLLKPFYEQFDDFFREFIAIDTIRFGTLGPNGTSSEQALKYLVSNLTKYNPEIRYEVALMNTFKKVYQALDAGIIRYALVPAAYERITDFFWNDHFINNLNFIFPTPEYGMVCKKGYRPVRNRKVKIACCPAVENIIEYLTDGAIKEEQIERVITNSTTEAVISLINNDADLAVTNRTSFELYQDKEIKFISKMYNSKMVWVLFKGK